MEKSKSKLTLTDGSRYLGGFIGDLGKQTKWIGQKVESWVEATDPLAEISQWVPQSSFAGMQRSLQHEWSYIQRVKPGIGKEFDSLQASIKTKFMVEIFGEIILLHLRSLSGLLMKKGGLAIPDPSATAESNYLASTCECSYLISLLKGTVIFDHGTHKITMKEVRIDVKKRRIDKAEGWIQTYKSSCKDDVEKRRI